jgi:hypothetical protein
MIDMLQMYIELNFLMKMNINHIVTNITQNC